MSAYLNALWEEGSKIDLFREVERLATERDELKAKSDLMARWCVETEAANSGLTSERDTLRAYALTAARVISTLELARDAARAAALEEAAAKADALADGGRYHHDTELGREIAAAIRALKGPKS